MIWWPGCKNFLEARHEHENRFGISALSFRWTNLVERAGTSRGRLVPHELLQSAGTVPFYAKRRAAIMIPCMKGPATSLRRA